MSDARLLCVNHGGILLYIFQIVISDVIKLNYYKCEIAFGKVSTISSYEYFCVHNTIWLCSFPAWLTHSLLSLCTVPVYLINIKDNIWLYENPSTQK